MRKIIFTVLALMISNVCMAQQYQQATGTARVNNGDADECVIAAPGDGKTLYITDFIVSLSTQQATGGSGGRVALEDGANGATIFEVSASTSISANPQLSHYGHFDIPGYPLTEDTCLNLTVDGGTIQATARATARANVIK